MPEEMIMEKPKGSKSGIWVLVLIIVAIVFGSAGYYVGKTRSKNLPETPVAQTAVVGESSPTITADTTASWKTYINKTYGYSFKYPSEWVPDEMENGKTIGFYTAEKAKLKEELETSQAGTEGPISELTIVYYENLAEADGNTPLKYSTLNEMLNDTERFNNTQKTTFAGVDAYETVEMGMLESLEYVVEKDGHIYKVIIGLRANKSELTATESKALSTFKFTK